MTAHRLRFADRRKGYRLACLAVATALSCPVALAAQPPVTKSTPPTNPAEAFFNQFFGGETEEDRKALDTIQVSLEEERRFGKQAADAYLDFLKQQKVRLVTRGREVAYLQALVNTLRPHRQNARRYDTIRVVLARSPEPDARSFPGGTLVFFEGMLDFADNEAALVGVVGHELSHLDRGHQLIHIKRMQRAQQVFSGKAAARDPAEMFSAGQSLMRMWARPFRPEDELEADLDATDWAYQAGYDPRELAKALLRLHERNQQKLQPNDFLPSFLRSHPYERERYEAVLKRYDELQQAQPRDDLYLGAENLRRRVPRSEQEFPE